VALNYREQDFVAEVQRLTDGKGVDVIIENVAADNLAKDFAAVARDARIVIVGAGTGKAPNTTYPVSAPGRQDTVIYGMGLGNAGPRLPEIAREVTRLFAAGQLKAIVSKTYPLPAAQEALGDLVAGRVFGKLVLTP
jgi:NADPH:quinone reductase-like Zn-dependent oxidoreductase